MFSGEVISVDRVCSFMSMGRKSDFCHNINVRVLLEVPDGGLDKLMCNSTRLIMIWWHVVARKSAALHEQFDQYKAT